MINPMNATSWRADCGSCANRTAAGNASAVAAGGVETMVSGSLVGLSRI
jgi:hypothetical protein